MPQEFSVILNDDGSLTVKPTGAKFVVVAEGEPPPPPPPPPPPDPEPVPSGYIWADVKALAAKPRSGPAWTTMYNTASARAPGPASVANQDSKHNTWLQACAYVYASTGDTAFLGKVLDGLRAICSPALPIGRALALAREVPGYIAAAEGINLAEVDPQLHADFQAKLRYFLTCQTSSGGPATLIESQEKRPNNWGTHASCARLMIARYIDDKAELDRAVKVLRGYLGDYDLYHGFVYGELDWQYEPDRPLGINRQGATIEGHNVDGALPEEMRRGGTFAWPLPPDPPTYYPWEAQQGLTAAMLVAFNAGIDLRPASDWAHRRSIEWLYGVAKWEAVSDDAWLVPVINRLYDTKFAVPEGGPGKNLGWTNWTHMA